MAVQYKVPFVLVMTNNGYMGLIRQAETNYDMNFEVGLSYEGPEGHPGIDHVMLVVAADDGPMPQTLEHLAILGLLVATLPRSHQPR